MEIWFPARGLAVTVSISRVILAAEPDDSSELEIKLSGILSMVAPHRKPDTSEMVSSWFWERIQLLKETKLPARKFRVEQPRSRPARRALGQPHRRGRICCAGVKSEPPWVSSPVLGAAEALKPSTAAHWPPGPLQQSQNVGAAGCWLFLARGVEEFLPELQLQEPVRFARDTRVCGQGPAVGSRPGQSTQG